MKTILLADDDRHVRELVRATLAEPEFRILEAADGRETLALFRAERPDLVILDWMMPGVSGLEVARELCRRPTPPNILMLTAKHQKADVELANGSGVREYLTKPFSPLELIARVEALLH